MECEITDLLLHGTCEVLVKAKGALIFYATVCVFLTQKFFWIFFIISGWWLPGDIYPLKLSLATRAISISFNFSKKRFSFSIGDVTPKKRLVSCIKLQMFQNLFHFWLPAKVCKKEELKGYCTQESLLCNNNNLWHTSNGHEHLDLKSKERKFLCAHKEMLCEHIPVAWASMKNIEVTSKN